VGRRLVRVPRGFEHPVDREGEAIPGMHLAVLHGLTDAEKPCYQVYEDVTEGTPVSPVFASETEVIEWLAAHGYSQSVARAFVGQGSAPSFVVTSGGFVVDGIQALGGKKH